MPQPSQNRSNQTPSRSNRRTVLLTIVTAVALVTLAGAAVVYEVAAFLGGPVAGIAAVLSLFATPLGIGVVVERASSKTRPALRAERVSLYLAPVWAAALMAIAFTSMRATTAAALATVAERHDWAAGPVAQWSGRLGEVLRPASSSASQPTGSSSAGSAGSAPSAATPSAPASAPSSPASAPSSADAVPSATPPAAEGTPNLYASGDASYKEADSCELLSDVAAIARAHAPEGTRVTATALATARYPVGVPFLKEQTDAQLKAWFTGAPDTFEGVASRVDSAIHEGAHIWSAKRFNPAVQVYPIRVDLNIETKRLTNFPRSEILKKHVSPDADTYAKTYLQGASGAQGFNSLLDEYNAYAHSLAARYCMRDLLPQGTRVSVRDGILTFMYYVETYLELARTLHPGDYKAIVADPGHRQLILTVWDRAEYWLRRSANHAALGISDAQIRQWVYEPSRLAEIARLRGDAGAR
ncbi:MAG: hypothetical protein HY898_23780 [Deltaproteobacteria bacterium]|nr:hypothetical protein [Deltaproteobacteria bacterium]